LLHVIYLSDASVVSAAVADAKVLLLLLLLLLLLQVCRTAPTLPS
jgi:hypothetical protein